MDCVVYEINIKMVTILLTYRTNYHLKRSKLDKNKLNSIVVMSSVRNTLVVLVYWVKFTWDTLYVTHFQSVGFTRNVEKSVLIRIVQNSYPN